MPLNDSSCNRSSTEAGVLEDITTTARPLTKEIVDQSRAGNFGSCIWKMSKQKCLTINEKNLILHEVGKGVRKKDIALKFGIPPNSLSTIMKNCDKIQNYDSSNSFSKCLKTCVYEDVDEAVLK
ncbi:hypothetical protein AVEN_233736-1 [Araneus ventricosus]|uniref:HTH psq-type domain-containing protein n=1 Tax=Araneus ventricosus TaxID=182803 RepID=A0A4Y2QKK8_ARAVE|nr:hypothetical protein AVEN_233736-1 [Araneus ventricosus]